MSMIRSLVPGAWCVVRPMSLVRPWSVVPGPGRLTDRLIPGVDTCGNRC
jgi:hypothetical protein